MPGVSYLITYRNSDRNRQENLLYILNALATQPQLEVILVEQDQFRKVQDSDLPANCRYLFARNAGEFNKAWGLNLAAGLAKSQCLIMADADILLSQSSFEQICDQFKAGADAINPYTVLIDLDLNETRAILNGQTTLGIERTDQQLNRLDRQQQLPFCGGVFALSRALYDRAGGCDERFEGWGAEDDAMSIRIAHFAHKASTLNGQTAYHLWHEPAAASPEFAPPYLRNIALLSAYHEYPEGFYDELVLADSVRQARQDKYIKTRYSAFTEDILPLISCLCVTRARVEALQQAISCFKQQTHQNTELIIVCEDDDHQTQTFLRSLTDPAICVHIVASDPKLSLGELRNYAIKMAQGEYICQWDDDDWYHPRRLELQLKSAVGQNKAASILPRWLIYSCSDQKAYCSNIRLWEGSLLCKKSVLLSGPTYPALAKGEDTAVISRLYVLDELAIEDRPDLYIYIHSGSNTWQHSHFQEILEASTPLSSTDTLKLQKMLKPGSPDTVGAS